jgi:hypothetical protein
VNGSTRHHPDQPDRLIARQPGIELDAATRARIAQAVRAENDSVNCDPLCGNDPTDPDHRCDPACSDDDQYWAAIEELAAHLDSHPLDMRREAIAQYLEQTIDGEARVAGCGGPYRGCGCGCGEDYIELVCVVRLRNSTARDFLPCPGLDHLLTDATEAPDAR